MIIIDDNSGIPRNERTVCALGLFDGVHRGHRYIIDTAVSKARSIGASSAVFCFKTDSVTSKGHDGMLEMLLDDNMKSERIAEAGTDYLYSPEFSDLKGMRPEAFVRDILLGKMGCVGAVCGEDFTFGRGAVGKADDLKRLGEKYGIEVTVARALTADGVTISSTLIRKLIRQGEIAKANELLGYRFGFELPVEHGFQRGRTWNFPTINQSIPRGRVLPRFGVYCSRVSVEGRTYNAVTDIGLKPTVEADLTRPLAETFILGYEGDLYGKNVRLELFEFLRPEKRFESIDELKAEIRRNTMQAQRYFEENG